MTGLLCWLPLEEGTMVEVKYGESVCSGCGHVYGAICSTCGCEFMCGQISVPCPVVGCVERINPAGRDLDGYYGTEAPRLASESPTTGEGTDAS